MKTLSTLITLSFLVSTAFAQLSGPLSGVIRPGEYIVAGDVWVEAGDSLHIMPGAEFRFSGPYSLTIMGYIEAAGTETDSIIFQPDTLIEFWSGIRFAAAAENSHLQYCSITGSDSAGIQITEASPTISNCSITNNSGYASGGGIFCHGGSPLIQDCYIAFNQAEFGGGGVNCYQSNATIQDCIITGNSAQKGGGVYCYLSEGVEIIACTIAHNTTAGDGGGIYTRLTEALIQDCIIEANTTVTNGGGLMVYQSEIHIFGGAIRLNSAMAGGGIMNDAVDLIVENCALEGNWCGTGGGIYCWLNSSTQILDCKFSANSAGLGAGVCIERFTACEIRGTLFIDHFANNGGAIFVAGYGDIRNCTFSANGAGYYGGAIYADGDGALNLSNSIVTYSYGIGGICLEDAENTTVEYCDFHLNYGGGILWDIPPGFGQLTALNLNGDSCDVYRNLFLDPGYYATGGDSAFRLAASSPCIDAGNPFTPLDPDSTISDLGAFYYDYGLEVITDITIRIEGNDAVLDWEDVPGAAVYKIYRSDTPWFSVFTLETLAETTASTFRDENAAFEEDFWYIVRWGD